MSEQVDKTEIKVYVEIGDNLRAVIHNIVDNTYNTTGFESEQLIGGILTNIKDFVTSMLKIKNPEKKIEIKCPTLNKKEDQS